MEYLILIYEAETVKAARTPEQGGKLIADYGAYTQELIAAGVFVGGNALHDVAAATSVQVRGGKTLTTDGPFAATKEQLGGYYQLKCADLDEALKWGAKCPTAEFGTIEVRPIFEYPEQSEG